jgi:hypothetical protein
MPRPRLCLTALAAAWLWSGVAIAQDRPPQGARTSSPGRAGRLFISPAGEPFRGPDGLRRWFDGADSDHDGALTPAEFRADFMRYFKVLDANGDGLIDGVENSAYETAIVPEITRFGLADEGERPARAFGGGGEGGRRGGGPRGGGGVPPGGGRGGEEGGGPRMGGGAHGPGAARLEGAARYALLNIPQPVRGADANLDWKVSAAEWAKAAAQRFALLDADTDGRLTLESLPPLPGGRHDGRGPRDHQDKPRRNLN